MSRLPQSKFVLPTAIPFERLRSRELEECVYWLLDSMGALEIEWRTGTQSRNSADQGRDIEAHFSISSPDADLVRQKWWVECKGRKSTIEPSAVKESINNTQASPEIDVLAIVTNTTFSNPTRNWVREWQRSHPRPTVKLWDKTHLERLLCRFPAATLRVFASALTPQGRLEVIRERFWQHSSYATQDHLIELWAKRKDLDWEGTSLLAVVASECANGSVNEHPWLSVLNCKDFVGLLRLGLANTPSFCKRAEEAGVDQGPYLDAMGYLILRVLMVSDVSEVRSVLDTFVDAPDVRELILVPIFDRLLIGVRDACSRDCEVVSLDLRGENEETAEHYWERLRVPPKRPPKVPAWKRYLLVMQDTNKPCKVGFSINNEHTCPLVDGHRERKLSDLKNLAEVLKNVVVKRA